jgi:AraC-like DNA-binding protein
LRVVAGILSAEFRNLRPQRDGFIGMEEHMRQVCDKLPTSEILSLSGRRTGAARFSCSRRHLNRLFHKHFVLSVATLRMEMRLLKAASLLRDSTAKVINVSRTMRASTALSACLLNTASRTPLRR